MTPIRDLHGRSPLQKFLCAKVFHEDYGSGNINITNNFYGGSIWGCCNFGTGVATALGYGLTGLLGNLFGLNNCGGGWFGGGMPYSGGSLFGGGLFSGIQSYIPYASVAGGGGNSSRTSNTTNNTTNNTTVNPRPNADLKNINDFENKVKVLEERYKKGEPVTQDEINDLNDEIKKYKHHDDVDKTPDRKRLNGLKTRLKELLNKVKNPKPQDKSQASEEPENVTPQSGSGDGSGNVNGGLVSRVAPGPIDAVVTTNHDPVEYNPDGEADEVEDEGEGAGEGKDVVPPADDGQGDVAVRGGDNGSPVAPAPTTVTPGEQGTQSTPTSEGNNGSSKKQYSYGGRNFVNITADEVENLIKQKGRISVIDTSEKIPDFEDKKIIRYTDNIITVQSTNDTQIQYKYIGDNEFGERIYISNKDQQHYALQKDADGNICLMQYNYHYYGYNIPDLTANTKNNDSFGIINKKQFGLN